MDECNAALVLMSLSGSPHSPRQWMLGSSPGSSSASWTSGSDELSDEGVPHHHTAPITANMNIQQTQIRSTTGNPNGTNYNNQHNFNNNNNNHHQIHQTNSSNNRLRTASLSTSDEGIVMDYSDETPRKRRVSEIFILYCYCMLKFEIIFFLNE